MGCEECIEDRDPSSGGLSGTESSRMTGVDSGIFSTDVRTLGLDDTELEDGEI